MPRTRFAPAPTGYLHLGHVANALYVWRTARARGASVLLRIEDHDRQRCRPEYEEALLEDLDWLGFVPDIGTTDEFRRGASPYRQSDNTPVYEAAIARLVARGHRVYACDCSRTTTADPGRGEPLVRPYRDDSVDRGEPLVRPYAGRCRDLGLEPGPGRGLRVVMPAGIERFEDLRLGLQVQEPVTQCGDLLLRDRLGNWTYQFAVVVDDLRQEIDLVVRGEDLLDSTGRQLRLARMLGRVRPPLFLHHPLILKPGGEKLSKGNRDTSVRDLRAAGMSREEVIRRAAEAVQLPA